MFHVVETIKCLYELIKRSKVCTALGRMDLGRNDLSRGGAGGTVATSSSSVTNARWGSSTPLPDFPISGNHFPISVVLLISWYREIISWYREIISRYRKMRFISGYRELFPDIGKLNSRYQKIIPYFPISEIRIPDIGKSFPDIGNSNSRYRKIIPDIGKWWIKTQMAFHIEGPGFDDHWSHHYVSSGCCCCCGNWHHDYAASPSNCLQSNPTTAFWMTRSHNLYAESHKLSINLLCNIVICSNEL